MKVRSIVLFLVLVNCIKGTTQGCSDPGLCTIGSLNTEISKDSLSSIDFTSADLEVLLNSNFAEPRFIGELSYVYSEGDEDTRITNLIFQGVVRIREKMMARVKLPYAFTSGTLGKANGLGDITFSIQNTFYTGKSKRYSYTFGVVLPSGDANQFYRGTVLPMAYQTTLGSIHLLGGLSLAYKKWSGSIAYQHNLGENENSFVSDSLILDPRDLGYDELNSFRTRFPSSARLRRGSDLMLRVERRVDLGKKNSLALGILPIFRLNESRITYSNGQSMLVEGTDGLTFNLTAGYRYQPDNNWIIRINGGLPVKIRDESADGLYRDFVAIASVAYKIW